MNDDTIPRMSADNAAAANQRCDGSPGSQDAPPSKCDRHAERRCPTCEHGLCNIHSPRRSKNQDPKSFNRHCFWCRRVYPSECVGVYPPGSEPQWVAVNRKGATHA